MPGDVWVEELVPDLARPPVAGTKVKKLDQVVIIKSVSSTANGWANAHPALDTGLAQTAQAVLFIGDLANGSPIAPLAGGIISKAASLKASQ